MKEYWIICINPFEFEGKETPKGRMEYFKSLRHIMDKDWRRATDKEIEEKKWFKGNFYNHYWL